MSELQIAINAMSIQLIYHWCPVKTVFCKGNKKFKHITVDTVFRRILYWLKLYLKSRYCILYNIKVKKKLYVLLLSLLTSCIFCTSFIGLQLINASILWGWLRRGHLTSISRGDNPCPHKNAILGKHLNFPLLSWPNHKNVNKLKIVKIWLKFSGLIIRILK